MPPRASPRVVIIGAGFCGLAAGFELSRRGIAVTLLEQDPEIGGLAGSFQVNGIALEKFYHHWFTNDHQVMNLIKDLGTSDQVVFRPTHTGMYYANRCLKLSTPLDVLRFSPLSIPDRIRLGLLALRARRIDDWRTLENLTAAEWLQDLGGDPVYRVVWEPLLRGKFGPYAAEVSAVWIWNKLKLRGGSRGASGREQLAYYRGGFAALAERIAANIIAAGGEVRTGMPATALAVKAGRVTGVWAADQFIAANAVIATPALPIVADLLTHHVSADYLASLRRIRYLANICLVLELDRSLSSTYWLNVNDPTFPFVGIIEHTNFEPPATYGGRHIVYLSKYLPESDHLFRMGDDQLLAFTLPHLKRMFPCFETHWIADYHVWRARYSQPIVERRYSSLLPSHSTPLANFFIATMAQIYPEDRGTNYAIREGRKIGIRVSSLFK